MVFFRSGPDPELIVRDGDLVIPVEIRRNVRAVRLTLRVSQKGDRAVLTVPKAARPRRLQAFVEEHRDWLVETFRSVPEAAPFQDGASIPFRGTHILLRHSRQHRGRGTLTNGRLTIGGEPEFFARRVRDWLKAEAREAICDLVREKTKQSRLKAGRITIRDQATRWGSCAANGNLAFSWRLICADPLVLDYVVAHEVAHLRYMNHSRVFWDLTDRLAEDMASARKWLAQHGAALHRIGI